MGHNPIVVTVDEKYASYNQMDYSLLKEIDNIEVPDVTDIKTDVATIKAEIQNLQKEIEKRARFDEIDKNLKSSSSGLENFNIDKSKEN